VVLPSPGIVACTTSISPGNVLGLHDRPQRDLLALASRAARSRPTRGDAAQPKPFAAAEMLDDEI